MMNRLGNILLGILLGSLVWLLPKKGVAQCANIAPAHVVSNYNLGEKVDLLIKNKMVSALTVNNISSFSDFARFALLPTVGILHEQTLSSIPVKTEMELDFTFSVVDVMTGDVFDTYSTKVSSKGTSKVNTIARAVSALELNTPQFQSFLRNVNIRIVEYYERGVMNSISMAKNLTKQGEYEHAMYLLSGIPACIPSYDKVVKAMDDCYGQYQDITAKRVIREAEAAWLANPTRAGAEEAMSILSDLPADKKYDKPFRALLTKIERKLTEDDRKWWAMVNKELQRRHTEKMAETRATRDAVVAVAKAYTPPRQVTKNNIILW